MIIRSKGFTLIEILVAVAIFGLLSIGAYTVLDAGMRSRQQTETRLSQLEVLQRAIHNIETDLQMISQRHVRDEFGDSLPLMRGESDLSGKDGFLELTRSDWSNPARLPRSNLQHVIYQFEQGSLKRLHSIFLDQASNSTKVVRTLLENVTTFSFEFLDKKGLWLNNWATLTNTDEQSELPIAVRLKLELEPFGKIERVLLITTVKAKNDSANQATGGESQ